LIGRAPEIGQAGPLHQLMHRHGPNLLGGLAFAIMVFDAGLSMVTS